MKKKTRRRVNPLQIRVQALKSPKGMKPERYLRSLLSALNTGTMPRGLEVELHWRNPATQSGRTKNWQSGEFTEVIADSSSGFAGVVRRSIQRQILKLRTGQ